MKIPLLFASLAGLALGVGTAWASPKSNAPGPAHPLATRSTAAQGVWDWSLIDTNKDNLVSPAEMEKFLADHPGPLKK